VLCVDVLWGVGVVGFGILVFGGFLGFLWGVGGGGWVFFWGWFFLGGGGLLGGGGGVFVVVLFGGFLWLVFFVRVFGLGVGVFGVGVLGGVCVFFLLNWTRGTPQE